MSREWQQTKMTKYLLPDAVYYQSLWAVRDLQRMELRIREMDKEGTSARASSIVKDGSADYSGDSQTERKALERAILEERVEGIKKALSSVPSCYRSFILSNIIMKDSGKAFPDKLWRLWKQRFLYDVAHNLSMI
ncbi:MAG: hypothetical protein IKG59_06255 [Firmicutes bacterium]|nr:hypothetical protein [Eubacterium sp.]MBR2559503.1 hypothetical protein [Bacillota bacterium]MBR3053717.1 hypothetical protein [Bacillota bacterium]MCR4669011.1 hypothetical protein [Clostridia bacterium]